MCQLVGLAPLVKRREVDFDRAAAGNIEQMFASIDACLYEGRPHSNPEVQMECEQWADRFCHLRVCGRKIGQEPTTSTGLPPPVTIGPSSSFSAMEGCSSGAEDFRSSKTPQSGPKSGRGDYFGGKYGSDDDLSNGSGNESDTGAVGRDLSDSESSPPSTPTAGMSKRNLRQRDTETNIITRTLMPQIATLLSHQMGEGQIEGQAKSAARGRFKGTLYTRTMQHQNKPNKSAQFSQNQRKLWPAPHTPAARAFPDFQHDKRAESDEIDLQQTPRRHIPPVGVSSIPTWRQTDVKHGNTQTQRDNDKLPPSPVRMLRFASGTATASGHKYSQRRHKSGSPIRLPPIGGKRSSADRAPERSETAFSAAQNRAAKSASAKSLAKKSASAAVDNKHNRKWRQSNQANATSKVRWSHGAHGRGKRTSQNVLRSSHSLDERKASISPERHSRHQLL